MNLEWSDVTLAQHPDRERRPEAIPAQSGAAIAMMDKERLRQSEQRFRAAVEAMDGILWTNNAAGEMEGEQPAWAALTGQTYDDYQGFGWSKAVHPDDAKPTIDAWKAAVVERRTLRVRASRAPPGRPMASLFDLGPFRYSMRKAGFANGSASTPTSRNSARASARCASLRRLWKSGSKQR